MAAELVGLIKNNWDAANTDGITPKVIEQYNIQRIDAQQDVIDIYNSGGNMTAEKIGQPTKYIREDEAQITIWSALGGEHADKMEREVKRILQNNATGTSYDILIIKQIINRDFDYKKIQNRIVNVVGLKFLD